MTEKHPLHGVPGFGELGENVEKHELKRVRGMIGDEPPATPSVPEVFRENADKERALMVQAVTTEVAREIGQLVIGLRHDIQANSELVRMMDVPIESIVNAHERASASFETLRHDILGGGLDKLEKVLDTAGLTEQASKAEQRMEAMIVRLEAKIDSAFNEHAADMVKILHLLERLQSRQLRDAQKKAHKRTKK